LDGNGSFDGSGGRRATRGKPGFDPLFADGGYLRGHRFAGFAIQPDRGVRWIYSRYVAGRYDLDAVEIAVGSVIAHDDRGAGLWISPPDGGSKSTHQTSPRSMGVWQGIASHAFGPLQSIPFGRLAGGHFAVRCLKILWHNMRAGQAFDKLADATLADGPVKPPSQTASLTVMVSFRFMTTPVSTVHVQRSCILRDIPIISIE
jgi:hypothetical protein